MISITDRPTPTQLQKLRSAVRAICGMMTRLSTLSGDSLPTVSQKLRGGRPLRLEQYSLWMEEVKKCKKFST